MIGPDLLRVLDRTDVRTRRKWLMEAIADYNAAVVCARGDQEMAALLVLLHQEVLARTKVFLDIIAGAQVTIPLAGTPGPSELSFVGDE